MAQLVAAGLGYIDFALAHPALFRLMFSSRRPNHEAPELSAAGGEAFERLVDAVGRVRAVDPHKNKKAMLSVMAAWAIAHGLADLLVAGRMKSPRWEESGCNCSKRSPRTSFVSGSCPTRK